MERQRTGSKKPQQHDPSSLTEEQLQGPPARQIMAVRSDRERRAAERLSTTTSSSPALTGGDLDADWQRADSAGEEAVGGTVATPDKNVVDDLGEALGVPRALDEEFRTSAEILEGRDRQRWEQEDVRSEADDGPAALTV